MYGGDEYHPGHVEDALYLVYDVFCQAGRELGGWDHDSCPDICTGNSQTVHPEEEMDEDMKILSQRLLTSLAPAQEIMFLQSY